MIYTLIIITFGLLGASSGASLPWSDKWQKGILRRLPEAISATIISVICCYGLQMIPWYYLAPVAWGVSFAGIEAATWAMLRWDDNEQDRGNPKESTIRPVVDKIAKKLEFTLGDEGYSWTWAAVKGFIMTLPVGGTGLIFFTLGNEVGSHAKGRLPGDPNMWKEIAGGIGIGISCVLFLIITK